MAYELKGRIKRIMDEQRFDSGFFKQEFVVTTEEQYPQDIKLEVGKDKVEQLKSFKEGDSVVARFDLRGSEWQGKFFVNLVAWKVEAAGAANASSSAPQQGSVPPPPPPPMPTGGDADFGSDEGDDDLPF
jgi:single-strand DNA-binding protein